MHLSRGFSGKKLQIHHLIKPSLNISHFQVQIDSETLEVLIVREAHKRDFDYWIGLSDSEVEDQFVWNVTGEGLAFASWAENEPAGNENQNCVAALAENTYFWKEDDCNALYRPLCFGAELVNPCANGLFYIPPSNSCIQLGGTGTKTWIDSRDYCNSTGGRLVGINQIKVFKLFYLAIFLNTPID